LEELGSIAIQCSPRKLKKKRIVKLNIGGTIFTTSLSTLTSQETFFSAMLSGSFDIVEDENGAYFIDRDPRNFHLILNYLRGQEIFFDDLSPMQIKELASDCQFYQVEGLLCLMQEKGLVEIADAKSLVDEFVFKSDRDSNGILYWLGVNKGESEEWMNPSHNGMVQVIASSVMYGSPCSITGREYEDGSTKYGLESWFQIKFSDIVVRPNRYTLLYPNGCSDPGVAPSWELQGSNDGTTWTVISSQHRTPETEHVHSWVVDCNEFYMYFRIFQSTCDWTLHRILFANMEIYGEVKQVAPTSQ